MRQLHQCRSSRYFMPQIPHKAGAYTTLNKTELRSIDIKRTLLPFLQNFATI